MTCYHFGVVSGWCEVTQRDPHRHAGGDYRESENTCETRLRAHQFCEVRRICYAILYYAILHYTILSRTHEGHHHGPARLALLGRRLLPGHKLPLGLPLQASQGVVMCLVSLLVYCIYLSVFGWLLVICFLPGHRLSLGLPLQASQGIAIYVYIYIYI